MGAVMERQVHGCMMLVTRPNYDQATRYLHRWSELLIKEADRRNINVVDLEGKKAARSQLEGRLRKTRPSLVLLNGHGSKQVVTGQDGEVIVAAGDNSKILQGLITYAVSCDSAAVLGQEVGAYSSTAYIGYLDEFVMLQSRDHLSQPVGDPLAKPFMEFSNQIVLDLLKGRKTKESVDHAKQVGIASINRLLTSASDPDAQAIARYLWWDIKQLACPGDQTKGVVC